MLSILDISIVNNIIGFKENSVLIYKFHIIIPIQS
jgi:hypothetical protein